MINIFVQSIQCLFHFRWVIEIIDSLDHEIEDDSSRFPNMYFSPELEHTFIATLSRIPLWSNIMVAKFESTRYSASSANSENYFKQIKKDPGTYVYTIHTFFFSIFSRSYIY